MPGIVTRMCHYFKDCLTWLLLQMGRERERDTKRYFATDCTSAAKWFITFTCGNHSTPTIAVLKMKCSIIGWIYYPHEWVRELHIYESRLVVTAGVIILSWHRTEEKNTGKNIHDDQAQAHAMQVHRTHSFFLKGINRLYNKLHLRKYHHGFQVTCCLQNLSQTDIKFKNKANVDRKWKYNVIIVPCLLHLTWSI